MIHKLPPHLFFLKKNYTSQKRVHSIGCLPSYVTTGMFQWWFCLFS
jgi:hypothetical protein